MSEAHMMSAPRQHVSDAAWQAMKKGFPTTLRSGTEGVCERTSTVLLTVAEHDELLALRAEVERLRDELAIARYESAVNERLRKERDERDRAAIGRVDAMVGAPARSFGRIGRSMVEQSLDHRLGTLQPEGEPVAPMSSKKPYRWGMV